MFESQFVFHKSFRVLFLSEFELMASDGSSEQIGEQPGERFAVAESDSDTGSAYQKLLIIYVLEGGGTIISG